MNIRILKNDNNEDLYCVKDICTILQLKNVSTTLKKVSIHNIFKCKTHTVSGDQICVFVNTIGLKHILNRTNSSKSKDLIKLLDLSIDIVFPGEEAHYASIIESAFDFFKIEKQYCIDNYRIDLYFPEYKLAIEIDEDNHEKRDKNEEIERENYIKNKLQCTFIRFNPSVKFFNIGTIISQIFKHIREY
jgi:very-short-patch-repair endonuclease